MDIESILGFQGPGYLGHTGSKWVWFFMVLIWGADNEQCMARLQL